MSNLAHLHDLKWGEGFDDVFLFPTGQAEFLALLPNLCHIQPRLSWYTSDIESRRTVRSINFVPNQIFKDMLETRNIPSTSANMTSSCTDLTPIRCGTRRRALVDCWIQCFHWN